MIVSYKEPYILDDYDITLYSSTLKFKLKVFSPKVKKV